MDFMRWKLFRTSHPNWTTAAYFVGGARPWAMLTDMDSQSLAGITDIMGGV